MRKTVTWEEMHVSALCSQTVSNDVIVDWLIFLYSSATSARITKKKKTFNYPNNSSAVQPVPHTEDHPVPEPPQQYIIDSDDEPTENREKTPQLSSSMDADFTANLQFN